MNFSELSSVFANKRDVYEKLQGEYLRHWYHFLCAVDKTNSVVGDERAQWMDVMVERYTIVINRKKELDELFIDLGYTASDWFKSV